MDFACLPILMVSTTEQACWSAGATGEHVNFACMWLWNLSACLPSVMKPACTTFSKCVQGCSLTCSDFVDVNKLVCQFSSCGLLHLLPEMQSRATLQILFSNLLVQCKYNCACLLQKYSRHTPSGQTLLSSSVALRACDRVQMPRRHTNPDLCRIIRRDVESFLTVIIGETWHFLPSQNLSLHR